MAAGGAAAEAIFFIAAVILATAFVGIATLVTQDFSKGVEQKGQSLSKELRTSIVIISDPLKMTTAPMTILVKNVGSISLPVKTTTYMLDGEVAPGPSYDVLDSDDDELWKIAEVLKIEENNFIPGAGDHRIRVVTENGIYADIDFTV